MTKSLALAMMLSGSLLIGISLDPLPAVAGAKVVSVAKAGTLLSHKSKGRHRGRVLAFAPAFRCRTLAVEHHGVVLVKRVCPERTSPFSGPVQPWAYSRFRRKAQWHQRSHLWQSRIAPGPYQPKIYWGY